MISLSDVPSTSSILSTYTAFTTSAFLVRTVLTELKALANQFLPGDLLEKLSSKLGVLICNFSSKTTLVIDEQNGLIRNEIFEAAGIYLRTMLKPAAGRLKISKASRDKSITFIISRDEKIADTFGGVELIWELKVTASTSQKSEFDRFSSSESSTERKSFELSFNKKFSEIVISKYIPFVLERSKAIKEENKCVKLMALGNYTDEVNLEHPSTFETLAMDPELKKEIIEDLDRFVSRRDYYRRVGKAWKRGYLLYGPPGTGKSSLIAAMANYLKFSIYELDLSCLRSNSDLQELLPTTKNKSILVVEDIDCSIDLQNRNNGDHGKQSNDPSYPQVTLSGILNFIDGLWSSCGDERIIVLTTNYKDRLDPALLRPGRMDMHILMSYCTPGGFRVLASNYHGLKDHPKFTDIDKLLTEVNVTPAEIAEELMKSDKADVALEGLIKLFQKKKGACDELKVGGDIVTTNRTDTVVEHRAMRRLRKMRNKNRRKGNRSHD
ncbi:unnamed protein product [Cuscuta epithymum]|uniref:AAA+ ATPase domain-containing protein n=1 Tax=Cuscuta epithymum TaxID=186058 RepID=A0AAV0F949_9ASTE|nr:unnamed protein product [Cuscuta epithymum]